MTQLETGTRSTIDATVHRPGPARRFDKGATTWCVAAAALLAGSGFYRGIQAVSHSDDVNYVPVCPFPLDTVPKVIDNWKVVEGSETKLDSQTTRITGSTDHIIRNYCDETTGATLSVLILYGPAGPVTPHTPQACYPASGFSTIGVTSDRKIEFGQGQVADFRSSVFAKSGGRSMIYQTVYHSYELNGVWSPTVDFRKLPRRNPGVFKVQIQRRSYEQEIRGDNEPIEAFLTKLLPVLETMTAEAQAKPSAAQPKTAARTAP